LYIIVLAGSEKILNNGKGRVVMTDSDIKSEIDELVKNEVYKGFTAKNEIIEHITEIVEDEYDIDTNSIKYYIEDTTCKLLNEHYEEQKTWQFETDCDKLDKVFNLLEDRGIVARQNFTDCQTCGNFEIKEEIENFSNNAVPIGYTFYHEQDTDSAFEYGSLYLSYSSIDDSDKESLKIGKTIVGMLEKFGFSVKWDGTINQRICIEGIDWKKRRK
jgi:hypothetical protein